jgi:hypothetical protein
MPIWQRRFYDFNVWTEGKRIEKLSYMHQNPVKRGLVVEPGAPLLGGWPNLETQTTLQGAPLKLRLGGVFVNASCRHEPQFFSVPCCPLGVNMGQSRY